SLTMQMCGHVSGYVRPLDSVLNLQDCSQTSVSQWTNHRVMEWLRSVDLAEYAPNLRGSGVHRGLMVLEPRFNVETMALLLNIPPNKALLPRHTFQPAHCRGNCPLVTGSLRKKKLGEIEEYVCPMDVEMPKGRSFQKGYELQIYEDDLDRLEQMEDSEGTVRQIGAFSEGIQNLTSMLKDDKFFKEISNSPNPSVNPKCSSACTD
uniref:SAM domain-containing protein n=1 Tax=Mola mola TaxID=94237 RepID=A0A3Q3W675_MOLML